MIGRGSAKLPGKPFARCKPGLTTPSRLSCSQRRVALLFCSSMGRARVSYAPLAMFITAVIAAAVATMPRSGMAFALRFPLRRRDCQNRRLGSSVLAANKNTPIRYQVLGVSHECEVLCRSSHCHTCQAPCFQSVLTTSSHVQLYTLQPAVNPCTDVSCTHAQHMWACGYGMHMNGERTIAYLYLVSPLPGGCHPWIAVILVGFVTALTFQVAILQIL